MKLYADDMICFCLYTALGIVTDLCWITGGCEGHYGWCGAIDVRVTYRSCAGGTGIYAVLCTVMCLCFLFLYSQIFCLLNTSVRKTSFIRCFDFHEHFDKLRVLDNVLKPVGTYSSVCSYKALEVGTRSV